jgi:hypothetical protein
MAATTVPVIGSLYLFDASGKDTLLYKNILHVSAPELAEAKKNGTPKSALKVGRDWFQGILTSRPWACGTCGTTTDDGRFSLSETYNEGSAEEGPRFYTVIAVPTCSSKSRCLEGSKGICEMLAYEISKDTYAKSDEKVEVPVEVRIYLPKSASQPAVARRPEELDNPAKITTGSVYVAASLVDNADMGPLSRTLRDGTVGLLEASLDFSGGCLVCGGPTENYTYGGSLEQDNTTKGMRFLIEVFPVCLDPTKNCQKIVRKQLARETKTARQAGAICALCGKMSDQKEFKRCSRCKVAAYCCKEHQRDDYLAHKDNCLAKASQQSA